MPRHQGLRRDVAANTFASGPPGTRQQGEDAAPQAPRNGENQHDRDISRTAAPAAFRIARSPLPANTLCRPPSRPIVGFSPINLGIFTPMVIGDMMYVETSHLNYVYAINLDNTGQLAWKFEPPADPDAPPVACCDVTSHRPRGP
jgi:PQQ enzyme repeat